MLDSLDNPEVIEFLAEYYGKASDTAKTLSLMVCGSLLLYGELFDKLCAPAFYLEQDFERWRRNKIELSKEIEDAKEKIGK